MDGMSNRNRLTHGTEKNVFIDFSQFVSAESSVHCDIYWMDT